MFNFPSHIQPVLKDSEKQRELEVKGFTIINDFYSAEDRKLLKEFYMEKFSQKADGFIPAIHYMSKEERKQSNEIILRTASENIDRHFMNYKLYSGNYIVKSTGIESEKDLHQDMTLIDESRFQGINLWSSLIDTNSTNGALFIIPASHRMVPTYRANTIQPVFYTHRKFIMKYLEPVYVKAGDLIVFDHSTLHYSPPNYSKELRIATTMLLSHEDSRITTCYLDPKREDKKIEVFEHTDNFFEEYTQFDDGKYDRPKIGKSLGFFDYDFKLITAKMMIAKYGYPPNASFLEKAFYSIFYK